jgi:mono/diheme cytochrome c family protein
MSKLILRLLGVVAIYASSLPARGNRTTPLQQAPSQEANRLNPYQGEEDARRAGEKLFQRECAACHGRDAQGGERAPALASPMVRQAPPGAIFWVLRNGALWRGMPSFSHLPEQQRWQIVTYLKSL